MNDVWCYRCSHCKELLAVFEDGTIAHCSEHPNGGTEWSINETDWIQWEQLDAVS